MDIKFTIRKDGMDENVIYDAKRYLCKQIYSVITLRILQILGL